MESSINLEASGGARSTDSFPALMVKRLRVDSDSEDDYQDDEASDQGTSSKPASKKSRKTAPTKARKGGKANSKQQDVVPSERVSVPHSTDSHLVRLCPVTLLWTPLVLSCSSPKDPVSNFFSRRVNNLVHRRFDAKRHAMAKEMGPQSEGAGASPESL